MADGKALQIPQALAAAQDPEHSHKQEVPGRNAHAKAHPRIRYCLEVADQVEIGCSRVAFEHRAHAGLLSNDNQVVAQAAATPPSPSIPLMS